MRTRVPVQTNIQKHQLLNGQKNKITSLLSSKLREKTCLFQSPSSDKDNSGIQPIALLFDCDGVIVETEELHRQAYNQAFKAFKLTLTCGSPVEWSVELYDVLQNTVGGGGNQK